MTEQTTKRVAPWWRSAPMLVLVGALLAAGALFAAVQIYEAREEDRRADGYYCTFEGVTPFDVAPNTGELCAEVIRQGW